MGCILILYWIYIKKDTYFNYKFSEYRHKLEIYKEIIEVSVPGSTEDIVFALAAIILNYLIITTSGVNEVASFAIAWRIIAIAFIPGVSIGIASITVSGIAYGAKNWENFNETIKYSTLLCLSITLLISAFFFIFAQPLCALFNFETGDLTLITRSSEILKLLVFYNFLIAFGVIPTHIYQGVGLGFKSLALTILRELVFSIGFAYLFGITFNWGIFGVYLGAIVGMNIGSLISFISIMRFNQKFKNEVMPTKD